MKDNENMKPHILSYSIADLKTQLTSITQKPFQIKQILQWIYTHHTLDTNKMTNISKALRERLAETYDLSLPQIINTATSTDGTIKYLLELADKNRIEMVYMPSESKNTVCLSTQVGCSRACAFCATGKLGLSRNLSTTEILSQLMLLFIHNQDQKLTNIVLMGMGEPLDNFDNVLAALHTIRADEGFCFSGRRITVSTCGVIPRIYDLIDRDIKVKLAVSLNSAIDEKRSQLMPINKVYPLAQLKQALLTFRKHTAFRITFEYIMIAGFNMGKEDIQALIKFCGDMSCKVNLIKYNDTSNPAWQSPSDKQVEAFVDKLNALPVAVTLRKSRGADIAGACGQLVGAIK